MYALDTFHGDSSKPPSLTLGKLMFMNLLVVAMSNLDCFSVFPHP